MLCTEFGIHKMKGIYYGTSNIKRIQRNSTLFDIADQGEQVVIRRRGKRSYMLTPIDDSEITITPELEKRLKKHADNTKTRKQSPAKTQKRPLNFLNPYELKIEFSSNAEKVLKKYKKSNPVAFKKIIRFMPELSC